MEQKTIRNILKDYVVIPEIQREYVWGNNEILLKRFLTDIKNVKDELNIGFLYSYEPYENKKENKSIYLIDGQQRFTTIVLVLFYLSLKEKNRKNDFSSLLELASPRSRFSYKVRSSTDEFIKKLFNNCDSIADIKTLKDKSWYSVSYSSDPSVKSIEKALGVIENEFKGENDLYGKIVDNINFWYFNVSNTSQGEELYITMNSRGESLKNYENIKSLLFEKLSGNQNNEYGKKWDDWEEFFYKIKAENEHISAVDDAMNNFLRIIIELESQEEHVEIKPEVDIEWMSLSLIEKYFEALKTMAVVKEYLTEVEKLFRKSDRFLLKALLAFYMRNVNVEEEHRKVYNVIGNCVRRKLINNVPLLKLLWQLRDNTTSFYDFIESLDLKFLEKVFDEHELCKIAIYNKTKDSEIEELFWNAEQYKVKGEDITYITNGLLKPIWYDKFTFNKEKKSEWLDEDKAIFIKRFNIFQEIFAMDNISKSLSEEPKEGQIDNSLIARTLLALSHKEDLTECEINVGATNHCYGSLKYWRKILNKPGAYNVVSILISELYSKDEDSSLYNKMSSIIANYVEDTLVKKNPPYYIIKYPNSLKAQYCGYNILSLKNSSWSTYSVDVISKSTRNSYYINVFKYLVHKQYQKEVNAVDLSTNLSLDNGLTLKCGEKHEWVISYKNKLSVDIILNVFKGEYIIDDYPDKKLVVISIPQDKDLIEEGVKILKLMLEIPNC